MRSPIDKKKGVRNFAKYSSISFQMLATIGLFAYAGYELDKYWDNKSPIVTALMSVLGVIISLYQVVKQLNKSDNE